MSYPISLPFYRVIVRGNWNPAVKLGEIQAFTKISLQLKYNDVGSFSMEIPNDHPSVKILMKGGWLTFLIGEVEICSGQMRGFKQAWSTAEAGSGTLTVYGPTAEVLVADHLAYQDPTHTANQQAAFAYDSRNGVGETIIKQFVDLNAGPDMSADRWSNGIGLMMEPDGKRGATIQGSARMDNLLTFIQPLCESAGLGFKVSFGSDEFLTFRMFQPHNLADLAKFGREMGNLTSFEYVQEAPHTDVAVVGGGGDLTARVFVEVVDGVSRNIWHVRSEAFVDRRDTSDFTEMTQAGTEEVVKNGPMSGLTLKTMDTPTLTFGIDYGLGDLVSIPEFGITDVLRAIDIQWSVGGPPVTTSDVGTWSKTGTPALIKTLADLTAKVAALQAKK
jgi:hypothetical protein